MISFGSHTICVSATDLEFFFKNNLESLGIPHTFTNAFGMTTWRSYENSMSYCGLKAKQKEPLYRFFKKDKQVENFN